MRRHLKFLNEFARQQCFAWQGVALAGKDGDLSGPGHSGFRLDTAL
jgi:hypothetical protein